MIINEPLIQIKKLIGLNMYHAIPSGDIVIETLAGDVVTNSIVIPKSKKFAVLRGFVADAQRFHRKK